MESPIILGMTLIFLFVIILCASSLAVLYWKNLAQVAKTKQIACPLNKFCPAGTNNDGSLASVKIILPSDFDEITDEEEITFPYYDSNTNPILKNLVVAFNTGDDVPGSNAYTYLDISNVGYSTYSSSSPNITIYVAGLSGRDDVNSILSAIFLKALRQSGSPVRKLAFVGISTGSSGGNDYLHYSIKTFGIPESIDDLNVSSSISSSTILSGVDTLSFIATVGVNPESLVDVYSNMNYINKYQIAPAFLGGPSNCVEPSFNAKSCEGTSYVDGAWRNNYSNPNITGATILDDWADYPDDQTDTPPTFCAFNLDQTNANNSGAGAGVTGGNGVAGIGGYQQNKFGTTITGEPGSNPTGGTLFNPGTNPPGSAGGANYVNPQIAGDGGVFNTQQDFPYTQTSVFCGGASKLPTTDTASYNLQSGANPSAITDSTKPYAAKAPNPDNYPNYTTLGFASN